MIRLKVVPVGDVPEGVLRESQEKLKKRGFFVYLDRPVGTPEEAFSPYRHQYSAELILDALREISGSVVGLIIEDVYSGDKSFDFGASEYDGPILVSLHRLQPEFYKEKPNFDLLMNRVVKQVLYYLGRTKGLKDCQDPECVMYPVKSVVDLDAKGDSFCKNCRVILATIGVDF